MKLPVLILTILMAAASVAGQFVSNNIDIPESQFRAAEEKAEKLLKTVSYRSETKRDLVVWGYPPIIPQAHILFESIEGKTFREVAVTFGEEKVRLERIEIGKKVFIRRNDEEWKLDSIRPSAEIRESKAEVKSKFKYLGFVTYNGQETEFYSSILDARAEIPHDAKKEDFRAIVTTKIWYSRDGRLLRKTVDYEIISRETTIHEVTSYEYDPKDLKIEAPIK